MHNRVSLFEKSVNFILPISIILQTYGWGKYDFSFIIINLLIIWGLANKKINFKTIPINLKYYIWYFLIVFYLSITPSSISAFIPLGWIRIALSCALFFSLIRRDLLIKYYTNISIICLIFFYIQILLRVCFGYNISGIIPILPIALSVDDMSTYIAGLTDDSNRCCSFFSEPAHFAQFLIPLLIINCFKVNKTRSNYYLIICTLLALLLLRSGNGLIGLSVVGGAYIFWTFRKASIIKKITLVIILPVVMIGAIGYYIRSEAGEAVMKRQDQLGNDMNADSGMSGFIRIYRGFYVYDALSSFRKIIGANNEGLIRQAINRSPVKYLFESSDDLYFNLIQTALIRTGILGTILLMLVYWSFYKEGDITGRTIIVSLFVLGFIAALYFKEIMYLFLLLAWNNQKKKTCLINKKNKPHIHTKSFNSKH